MSSYFCNYCKEHKLKVDSRQNYGKGRCCSCGVSRIIKKIPSEMIEHQNQQSKILEPPPLNKNLLPLSDILLKQCKIANIILGGIDHSRTLEISNFWLVNYGHPPGLPPPPPSQLREHR